MTLQQEIVSAFLKQLAETKEFDSEKVEALRKILASGSKPKVDELVQILSSPGGGDVK